MNVHPYHLLQKKTTLPIYSAFINHNLTSYIQSATLPAHMS
jgi:hypothetical protein